MPINIKNTFLFFLIIFFIISCNSTNIKKYGIIDINKFSINFDGMSKDQVVNTIGYPGTNDTINNSVIYYSQTTKEKNLFNNNIVSRDIFIVNFDKDDIFLDINHYILEDNQKLKIVKSETGYQIMDTGIIERIFGGVGKRTTLPGSGSVPTANTGN